MTVVAGVWRFSEQSDRPDLIRAVSSMVAAQRSFQLARMADDIGVRASGQLAFGQAGFPFKFGQFLDERANGDGVGGTLLAVDARIDNRSELIDLLGCARGDRVDDESLFFLAYERWGDRLVDHVLGDFASVVWDPHRQVMTLFRDPTGQRSLHYHVGRNFVAFASMPQGLFAIEEVRREIDADHLAQFVADIQGRGPETFFRGISKVEPAQIVKIDRFGVHAHRYWDMPTKEIIYRNPHDYIAAFREHLDRATQVRLRGGGEIIAAHLSAGLDSGAVAATAARLLAPDGGRVLAVTSAPRPDFSGPVPYGRVADESPAAAVLAAQYANMDHVILRSTGVSPLSLLDNDSQLFAQPVGYPCNNVWWGQANEAARSGGATIMLTGEMGNLSISAGGLGVLADHVRAGRLLTWLREMIALEKGEARWRGLLAASLGPWFPSGAFAAMMTFSSGGRSGSPDTLLAGTGNRPALPGVGRPKSLNSRYSDREIRWNVLKSSDPGNFRKGALLRWGIDERDPTADRRLVEFCFSLPSSQLLGGGRTRRLARIALGDRLPAAILDGARGYQFADWYESLDRADLTRFAERAAASPVAASVIDFDAVNRLIADWPVDDLASSGAIGTYRIGLLRALSAGAFALNAAE